MSISVSWQHLARIRDDARRLAARAGDHQDDLEDLVRAADMDVRQAEATLSQALDSAQINLGELRQRYAVELRRRVEAAESTRHASVSAREQHVSAQLLLNRLDEDPSGEPRPPSRAAAVLVVDDFENVRESVADILRDAGFVVRTAVNGLEALIAAYEMQPAVILMDVTMPVLDGIEATRLIKATEATRHARVIAYTANPSLAHVQADTLFVAVLPKPSTPDVVLATVRKAASLS